MRIKSIKAYFVLCLLVISGKHCYGIEIDLTENTPQQDPPTGLYVSNTLIYISDKSSITLNQDLILDKAVIAGQGNLVMKSDNPQVIKSKKGRIDKLIIDNPTETRLDGDLEIKQSLTIKTGKFNISKGKLIIDPDAILLLNGASIFKGIDAEFKKSDSAESLSTQYTLMSGAIAAEDWETPIVLNNYIQKIGYEAMFYASIIQKTDSIPPESALHS